MQHGVRPAVGEVKTKIADRVVSTHAPSVVPGFLLATRWFTCASADEALHRTGKVHIHLAI